MAITATPEVLPPRSRAGSRLFRDENLDLLSHLLDDFLRIPGTPIRFGLDGIIGFLPGVGDVLGGLASTILLFAAWSRGVPPPVLLRMVLNLAIETGVGAVPVLGNLFDIGFRANRRNYALLIAAVHGPDPVAVRRRSWWLLAGTVLAMLVLVALPLVLAGWLLVHLTALLHPGVSATAAHGVH